MPKDTENVLESSSFSAKKDKPDSEEQSSLEESKKGAVNPDSSDSNPTSDTKSSYMEKMLSNMKQPDESTYTLIRQGIVDLKQDFGVLLESNKQSILSINLTKVKCATIKSSLANENIAYETKNYRSAYKKVAAIKDQINSLRLLYSLRKLAVNQTRAVLEEAYMEEATETQSLINLTDDFSINDYKYHALPKFPEGSPRIFIDYEVDKLLKELQTISEKILKLEKELKIINKERDSFVSIAYDVAYENSQNAEQELIAARNQLEFLLCGDDATIDTSEKETWSQEVQIDDEEDKQSAIDIYKNFLAKEHLRISDLRKQEDSELEDLVKTFNKISAIIEKLITALSALDPHNKTFSQSLSTQKLLAYKDSINVKIEDLKKNTSMNIETFIASQKDFINKDCSFIMDDLKNAMYRGLEARKSDHSTSEIVNLCGCLLDKVIEFANHENSLCKIFYKNKSANDYILLLVSKICSTQGQSTEHQTLESNIGNFSQEENRNTEQAPSSALGTTNADSLPSSLNTGSVHVSL